MEKTNELLIFLKQSELDMFEGVESTNLKIQDSIEKQEQKKNKILSIKEELSKIDNPILTKNNKKDYYIKELDNISENITSNINDLFSLKEIVEEFSTLFLKLKDAPLKENAENLKKVILTYKEFSSNTNFNIYNTDKKIDDFIKELSKIDKSLNFIESNIINQEYINIIDNNTLIISEKDNCVFLPYTVNELNSYLQSFPNEYTSLTNVINKEFILPLNYFSKHPSLARFREAYSLIRDREAKSVFEALKYSTNIMLKYDLNPAIISACKTVKTLDNYVHCLENNKLDDFTVFKIDYRINPIPVTNV